MKGVHANRYCTCSSVASDEASYITATTIFIDGRVTTKCSGV
jgi:hypothetical protein